MTEVQNAEFPLEALLNYTLIKVDNADEKKSIFWLPDKSKDVPETGEVVAVGPGFIDDATGVFFPSNVKVGARVLFNKYAGFKTSLDYLRAADIFIDDGHEYRSVHAATDLHTDIWATIEDGKIVPLSDKIVVRKVDGADVTAGGIVLPDSAKDSDRAEIVAVGPGHLDREGKLCPIDWPAGATIVYQKNRGMRSKFENEEYIILPEAAVNALVEEVPVVNDDDAPIETMSMTPSVKEAVSAFAESAIAVNLLPRFDGGDQISLLDSTGSTTIFTGTVEEAKSFVAGYSESKEVAQV